MAMYATAILGLLLLNVGAKGEQCSAMRSTTYPGNDIFPDGIYTNDLGGCCQACSSRIDCKAFAYSEIINTCWLKTVRGSGTPASGITAGWPVRVDQCITILGIDHPGNDIISFTAEDLGDCCDACALRDDCTNFNFYPSTGFCHLKSAQSEGSQSDDIIGGWPKVASSDGVEAAIRRNLTKT